MENFVCNDNFYSDLGDLMDDMDILEERIGELDDSWALSIQFCELQPVVELSADWICEHINEERLDEEGDVREKILKIVKENTDFTKVNELMPKMYYPMGKMVTITKTDLINYCK